MNNEEIKKVVKEVYRKRVKRKTSSYGTLNDFAESISKRIGYTQEEIEAVPEGSNLGLGCGNPVALAFIKAGDTVLDLGSGAGFDCFLVAQRVGINGKVIGVDMTKEMIKQANWNAKKGNYRNVEFREGEIENLPIDDESVDLVISNNVINLSPDKKKVFKEAFRVLKPGGRMMISDIVLLKKLPDFIRNSVKAYAILKECLGDAILKGQYISAIKEAGFTRVEIVDEKRYPVEFIDFEDPTTKKILSKMNISQEEANILFAKEIASKFIEMMSIKMSASKPP